MRGAVAAIGKKNKENADRYRHLDPHEHKRHSNDWTQPEARWKQEFSDNEYPPMLMNTVATSASEVQARRCSTGPTEVNVDDADFNIIMKKIEALQAHLQTVHERDCALLQQTITQKEGENAMLSESHQVQNGQKDHHAEQKTMKVKANLEDAVKTKRSSDMVTQSYFSTAALRKVTERQSPRSSHAMTDDSTARSTRNTLDHHRVTKVPRRAMHTVESTKLKSTWLAVKLVEALEESKYLIHPNSKMCQRWDALVMTCLLFTAIVSPVEICFFEDDCGWNALFILNSFINVCFCADLVLQFFLMYEQTSSQGITLVRNQYQIIKRYLTGWFIVDLVSIIPYDIIGCMMNSSKIKAARFVRLLRLLKLIRLLKASRVLARWQVVTSFPFTWQSLAKFVVFLIMGAHWMGCVWGMIGLEIDGYSWIDALADNKPDGMYVRRFPKEARNAGHLYLASLHFAVMTITSIGYGDISPVQEAEYIACVIFQVGGGLLWTYGMSEVIGMVNNLNPGVTQFRRTMDDLNHMMAMKRLDHPMRMRLRSFFLQARQLHDAERYQDLLSRMSPQLRGDLAYVTNARWIERVWYLRPLRDWTEGISDRLIAQVAVAMNAGVHCQGELLSGNSALCVLARGMVGLCGRIQRVGSCWGVDFILAHAPLRHWYVVTALTFIEVQRLERDSFMRMLHEVGSPQDNFVIRKAVVRLAVIRGIVMAAYKKKATAFELLLMQKAKSEGKALESLRSKLEEQTMATEEPSELIRRSNSSDRSSVRSPREKASSVKVQAASELLASAQNSRINSPPPDKGEV